jgi:outer membrane lipoprotein SlyB
MAVGFGVEIIETFARRLYVQARRLVRTAVVVGVLVGLLFGGSAGAAVEHGVLGAILGAGIVGAVAHFAALTWAFNQKLQAEMALCQLQIEANTRSAAVFVQHAHVAPANRNAA